MSFTIEELYPFLLVLKNIDDFSNYQDINNPFINRLIKAYENNILPDYIDMKYGGASIAKNEDYLYNAFDENNDTWIKYLIEINAFSANEL